MCGLCNMRPAAFNSVWCERCQPLVLVVILAQYDAYPPDNWGAMRGKQEAERALARMRRSAS